MEKLLGLWQWIKDRKWAWILLVSLCVVILTATLLTREEVSQEDLLRSLQETATANSYRFSAKAVMYVGGRERPLSDIKGEKEASKFHMTGEMVKTPVEAYLIESKLYIKNPFGKWIVLDETDQEQAQLYISELNPLGLLNIKEVAKIQDVKLEMINDEQLYRFTVKPDIEHPVLEVMWTDFTATVWVEPKSHKLRSAKIVASNKAKPEDRLSVNIRVWDYGQTFGLQPPLNAKK